MTKDDLQQMNELDKLFGNIQESDEEEFSGINLSAEDEDNQASDPYVKRNMLKHQEYRVIKIGSEDLLKNG